MTQLNDLGYSAKRTADWLQEIRDAYETATSLTIDWESDLFLGNITAIIAARLGSVSEGAQAAYDGRNPNNAGGVQLQELALILGVQRLAATATVSVYNFNGTPGTIITESLIFEDENGIRWSPTTTGSIDTGPIGLIQCKAKTVGANAAGTTNRILTPINGLTSITSPSATQLGRAVETDAQLRLRRQTLFQVTAAASLKAIRAGLLNNVVGVQAAVVIENDTAYVATIQGVSMQPHSISCVLYPSDLDPVYLKAIGTEIWTKVAGGIRSSQDLDDASVQILATDGTLKDISWKWASQTTVNVSTTVTELETGFELVDVSSAIQLKISDYFLTLGVGRRANLLTILGLLDTIDGILGVSVALNGGSVDVIATATEILVLGTNTVA